MPRPLTSASYLPDPSGFMSAGINKALAYISEQPDRALQRGGPRRDRRLSAGAFSRSFRRHTGMSLVQYVNRLRINLACQLLMSDEQAADHRDLLRVGLQQPLEFQPPVPGRRRA